MDWFDRLARRAVTPPADSALPANIGSLDGAEAAPSHSRRDFIRRAGLVGAAVWTVPALQSAIAPAAAASGTRTTDVVCSQGTCGTQVPSGSGCSLCAVNHSCANSTECVTHVCTGGTCRKAATGGSCASNGDCTTNKCTSGVCQQSQTGQPCGSTGDCVTHICSSGTCASGGIGTTCTSSIDCTTGQCFQRTGQPKTCGGPGSTCTTNAGCTNGNCSGGICGGLWAGCSTNNVCAGNRTCFLGWLCV